MAAVRQGWLVLDSISLGLISCLRLRSDSPTGFTAATKSWRSAGETVEYFLVFAHEPKRQDRRLVTVIESPVGAI